MGSGRTILATRTSIWMKLLGEEEKFPATHQAADVERKRHDVFARAPADRRQGPKIREQVAHVAKRHVLVRAIGEHRVVMLARGR